MSESGRLNTLHQGSGSSPCGSACLAQLPGFDQSDETAWLQTCCLKQEHQTTFADILERESIAAAKPVGNPECPVEVERLAAAILMLFRVAVLLCRYNSPRFRIASQDGITEKVGESAKRVTIFHKKRIFLKMHSSRDGPSPSAKRGESRFPRLALGLGHSSVQDLWSRHGERVQ